jgi:hypothetical protein
MIPVTGATRLFLFRGRADMRKGFDGLSGMVEEHFTESLFCGAVDQRRVVDAPGGHHPVAR